MLGGTQIVERPPVTGNLFAEPRSERSAVMDALCDGRTCSHEHTHEVANLIIGLPEPNQEPPRRVRRVTKNDLQVRRASRQRFACMPAHRLSGQELIRGGIHDQNFHSFHHRFGQLRVTIAETVKHRFSCCGDGSVSSPKVLGEPEHP